MKILVFRPWNILIIIGILGIIVFSTKYNIATPDIPVRVYYSGGIIIALLGIAFFFKDVIHYLKTYSWKTTQATITASQVNKIDDSEGTFYKPHITYRYNVGMKEYSSSQINPSGSWQSSFPSIASKPISRHPVGQTVQVYFNPSRPEESFLERKGLLYIMAGLLTFAIMLVAFSLVLAGIVHI